MSAAEVTLGETGWLVLCQEIYNGLRASPQHFRFMRFILCTNSGLFRPWKRNYYVNQNTSLLIANEGDPFHMIRRLMSLIKEQREVDNLKIFNGEV